MGNCFNSIESLKDQNNEIPFFDLKGNTYDVKVVDVYDGDTCTVVFKLGDKFTKFKVRCLGYDSPEMKPSKGIKDREKLIDLAYIARNYFILRSTNCELDIKKHHNKHEILELLDSNTKIIKLKSHGWDKYGRLLGEFFVDNVNLNEEMISKNHGYKYDGGTKKESIL